MQEIFIYMDDSGQVNTHSKYCLYGGIVFTSKQSNDDFMKSFNNFVVNELFINKIKIPEIKNTLISASKRLSIFNFIQQQFTFISIINNQRIYRTIINDKKSKARYIEYIQKRTVRNIVSKLILLKIINPNLPLTLHVYIDEQHFKSNGYYNLYESIYEELIHGMHNFKYHMTHQPLLFNKLNLEVKLLDSKQNYGIQVADIIAGSSRQFICENKLLKNNCSPLIYIDEISYFP